MLGLVEAGSVRANGSGRTRCGLGVFAALAVCSALQGCALLDQGVCYEIIQGEAVGAPFLGAVPAPTPRPAPTPPPATMANTTVNIPIVLASAVENRPTPKPDPEPAVVPEQKWETLPLSLLQKEASPDYRLAPEDVLGVWIGGVLGELNEPPPLRIAQAGLKPSGMGFPVPVRSDGTLSLPLVAPIQVGRMTVEQAEEAIRHAYTVDKQILKRGRERIVVTLMRQREYAVVVIRQDIIGDGSAGAEATKRTGRSAVQTIHLPASENDVLHSLALTGGYPRPEVATEIVIERAPAPVESPGGPTPRSPEGEGVLVAGQRVCITLNYPSSHRPLVQPQDVILHKGDVVVVRPIRLNRPVEAPAMAGK